MDITKKPSAAGKVCKKKKPTKVVYISNPVKFKTSASEFRALVQELTGQDSEFPVDPNNKFLDVGTAADCNQTVLPAASDCERAQIPTPDSTSGLITRGDDDDDDDEDINQLLQGAERLLVADDLGIDDAFEDGFLFLESFAGLLPVPDNNNNSFCCDSTNHVVADPLITTTLDAM